MELSASAIDSRFRNAARSKTAQNLIRACGLSQKAVLDVGCCYGEHLVHFGPGSVGITINPAEAAEGSARSLDVRLANAEEALPFDRTFGAVYANNLLEHLYSPHRFLYRMRDTVGADGLLVIGVPVIPFPSSLIRFRKFRGALADAHINFFTCASVRLTVERAGWHVHAVRGFHFKHPLIDRLARPFYPHLYVVAHPDPAFRYSEKRLRELAGYA